LFYDSDHKCMQSQYKQLANSVTVIVVVVDLLLAVE
jgi:hypothetical protein